jgi:hypothetical protein
MRLRHCEESTGTTDESRKRSHEDIVRHFLAESDLERTVLIA